MFVKNVRRKTYGICPACFRLQDTDTDRCCFCKTKTRRVATESVIVGTLSVISEVFPTPLTAFRESCDQKRGECGRILWEENGLTFFQYKKRGFLFWQSTLDALSHSEKQGKTLRMMSATHLLLFYAPENTSIFRALYARSHRGEQLSSFNYGLDVLIQAIGYVCHAGIIVGVIEKKSTSLTLDQKHRLRRIPGTRFFPNTAAAVKWIDP